MDFIREKNDKKIANLMFFVFSMARAAGDNGTLPAILSNKLLICSFS